MARLVLNGALNRAAGVAAKAANPVAAVAGPRYAFIAHPACCAKCNEMDSRRTGRLYTIGDTWRISHINCLCSTIEVPAGVGMDAQSVMSFALNPVGGILRRGFNFGQSFAPTRLTANNVESVLGKAARMSEVTSSGRRKVLARAKITAQRKGAYRKAFNKAGESWNDVLAPQPEPTKARRTGGAVRVRKARSESTTFTPTGRVSKAANVSVQAKKKKAAKVAANRRASGDTKMLAKLFGAVIK